MSKLKKFIALFAILGVLVAMMASIPASAASYKSRTDFVWGVNGHNQYYKSYRYLYLEDQIKLAAETGVDLYRFNFNPVGSDEYDYLDEVVELCQAYGMKIMLVMDDTMEGFSSTDVYNRYKKVAQHYSNTISYIQVFNEVDVKCMVDAPSSGNGMSANQYNSSTLAKMLPKVKSAISGIKAGSSKIKSCINISYQHTYWLDYLKSNGVNWDYTGLDWYKNMASSGDTTTFGYKAILERLESRFSQPILICETNIWPFTASQATNYNNDTSYLPTIMNYVYNNHPRVKGMFFYELLDEPALEMSAGKYEGEAHFGLVKVNNDFSIGAKKPIYSKIQQLLGGGTVTPKTTAKVTTKKAATTKKPAATTKKVTTTKKVAGQVITNAPATKIQTITDAAGKVVGTQAVTVATTTVAATEIETVTNAEGEVIGTEAVPADEDIEVEKPAFPLIPVLCIAGGVVLLAAAAAVVIILIVKKKKNATK